MHFTILLSFAKRIPIHTKSSFITVLAYQLSAGLQNYKRKQKIKIMIIIIIIIIIIIPFFITYVLSQQPQGQLQTQHNVDKVVTYWTNNIKSKTNES
jgi:predicted PurR-regulated permease PerM